MGKSDTKTYLPLLHVVLLSLVLLCQLDEHLVHVVRVRLQLREDVPNGALDKNAVDHAEAFAVGGEGGEGVEDEPGSRCVSGYTIGRDFERQWKCRLAW